VLGGGVCKFELRPRFLAAGEGTYASASLAEKESWDLDNRGETGIRKIKTGTDRQEETDRMKWQRENNQGRGSVPIEGEDLPMRRGKSLTKNKKVTGAFWIPASRGNVGEDVRWGGLPETQDAQTHLVSSGKKNQKSTLGRITGSRRAVKKRGLRPTR